MWCMFQVGSDVFLCYKKSMNRANLIPYKPGECCTLGQITREIMMQCYSYSHIKGDVMGWTCSWNKENKAYKQDSSEVATWIIGRWLNKTTLKSCCIVSHGIMCILIPN